MKLSWKIWLENGIEKEAKTVDWTITCRTFTAQKIKYSSKDVFSEADQIHSFLTFFTETI